MKKQSCLCSKGKDLSSKSGTLRHLQIAVIPAVSTSFPSNPFMKSSLVFHFSSCPSEEWSLPHISWLPVKAHPTFFSQCALLHKLSQWIVFLFPLFDFLTLSYMPFTTLQLSLLSALRQSIASPCPGRCRIHSVFGESTRVGCGQNQPPECTNDSALQQLEQAVSILSMGWRQTSPVLL